MASASSFIRVSAGMMVGSGEKVRPARRRAGWRAITLIASCKKAVVMMILAMGNRGVTPVMAAQPDQAR